MPLIVIGNHSFTYLSPRLIRLDYFQTAWSTDCQIPPAFPRTMLLDILSVKKREESDNLQTAALTFPSSHSHCDTFIPDGTNFKLADKNIPNRHTANNKL